MTRGPSARERSGEVKWKTKIHTKYQAAGTGPAPRRSGRPWYICCICLYVCVCICVYLDICVYRYLYNNYVYWRRLRRVIAAPPYTMFLHIVFQFVETYLSNVNWFTRVCKFSRYHWRFGLENINWFTRVWKCNWYHWRLGLEKKFHVKFFRPIANPKLASSRQC